MLVVQANCGVEVLVLCWCCVVVAETISWRRLRNLEPFVSSVALYLLFLSEPLVRYSLSLSRVSLSTALVNMSAGLVCPGILEYWTLPARAAC